MAKADRRGGAVAGMRRRIAEGGRIVMRLNALLGSHGNGRIAVVCGDGLRFQIRAQDAASHDVETVAVRFSPGTELGPFPETWSYARRPAKWLFHGVRAEDLVAFIWVHGGVDLAASREATAGQEDA